MKRFLIIISAVLMLVSPAFAEKWAEIQAGKVRAIVEFKDFTPESNDKITYVSLAGKPEVKEGDRYDGSAFHALGTAGNPYTELLMFVECDKENLVNDGVSIANFTVTIKDQSGATVAASKTMEFILTDTAGHKEIVPMTITSGIGTFAFWTAGPTGKYRIDPDDYLEITHNSKTFRLVVAGNTDLIVYRKLK